MQVTDLNGYAIEVTDLDEAIRKAAEYKGYRHKDVSFLTFDKRQKAYWTDMYKKLTAVKNKIIHDLNSKQ